jgi:hypothetical protein
MSNLIARVSRRTRVIPIVLFGLTAGPVWNARAAERGCTENAPMIKNLMALTYRVPCAPAIVVKEFTKNDAKRLAATAESNTDYLKLAAYYTTLADKLDAEAAAYENAAAVLRHGPVVKNLMSPITPARYNYFAKGLRDQARSNRALATSHDQKVAADAEVQ